MNDLNLKTRIIDKILSSKRYEKYEPSKFLNVLFKKIYKIIKEGLTSFKCIKFQLQLNTILEKKDYISNSIEQELTIHFVSEMRQIFCEDDIFEYLRSCFDELINKFDVFIANGSGYVLQKIINLRVVIIRIKNMFTGGNYRRELPIFLRNKKAILNIGSPSGFCFAYSIAACLLKPFSGVCINKLIRLKLTKLVKTFKTNHMWMKFSKFAIFEKKNKIRLNVFSYDVSSKDIYFIFKSKNKQGKICNILFFEGHYFCIRSLTRLGYTRSKNKSNLFVCQTCFRTFAKKNALANHNKNCELDLKQNIGPAPKGSTCHFSHFYKAFRFAFVYYLDFECFLKSINKKAGERTTLIQKHQPISASIIRICKIDEKYSLPAIFFHGEDVIEQLWNFLDKELVEMKKILDKVSPLHPSTLDQIRYELTEKCDLCGEGFDYINKKTRDHDHLGDGRMRAVLCNRCNLIHAKTRLRPTILCHNLSSYDSHLLISNLEKSRKIHNIIPKNTEKYLSFCIDEWTFLDSMAFLPASLQKLTDSLKSEGLEYFKETRKFAQSESKFKYLLQKLPYPYDYVSKPEDYYFPFLPDKQDFKDNLRNCNISENEYRFAKKIFEKFKCKSFYDYHRLYSLTDINLLADVFERYRDLVFDQYGLECLAYVSAPQLAFDGMLRLTNEKLECIPQMSMINFIQKNIRGGICVCSKKYSKANNIYLPNYDSNQPSKFITYLDANNLYGSIMLNEKMPYSNYKWLDQSEIENIDFKNIDVKGELGYILQVDLIYPFSLQDRTCDYPLACEKILVNDELLSSYSINLRNELKLRPGKIYKNIPNLMNKKNYVLHFANLQYFLKSGMILVKIHKVLQFTQKNFLHDFVKNNLDRRKQASSSFLSFYYKLQLNSIFGKFLQRKDLEIDLKIVRNEEMFDKYVSSPLFTGIKIFNNNIISISLLKSKIVLDKPVSIGFSILEMSKVLMSKFYDTITGLYDKDKIALLYSDTDSFIFEIQTQDLYKDFFKIKKHMDFSNYDPSHELFSLKNKLRAGKFKDEIVPFRNNIPSEFIGLKAKLYTIKTQNEEIKKAKGINTTSLTFDDYRKALFNNINKSVDFKSIRSFGHSLYTININKSGLNAFDDKRYFLRDGINSYGLGYYKIKKNRKKSNLKEVNPYEKRIECERYRKRK